MATHLSSWTALTIVCFITLWLHLVNAVRPEFDFRLEVDDASRRDRSHLSGSDGGAIGTSVLVIECVNDDSCDRNEFCHGAEGHRLCLSCRRNRRRCHRDEMCCPGHKCNGGMCISEQSGRRASRISQRTRDNMFTGHIGSSCRHENDCMEGLCCAHHFWERRCKRMLEVDDVCTNDPKPPRMPSFQRCPCSDGLMCKRDPTGETQLHLCQRSKN
ncbi:dickkopf homolog 1/2 precursor [Saccoglossus kowalevskii]|uniref:Dickkopf homolog 1/2 precursor n=1 Tax=Saccoglossus kowalevskii TaxID=10224 RepID=B5B3T1_SACKO|nr:dickkopf homolog 1/2 precursor [Saccoglossus kowalevskii]ACG70193.1 Dickkopf protein 1/2 [Saccoglossus kowalevskii]